MAFDFGTLFGIRRATTVGLDIGSSQISLVELANVGGRMYVEAWATEALPLGAVVDGNVVQAEQVAEVIKRVWCSSGTRTRQVVLGMPSAFVLNATMPCPGHFPEDILEQYVEEEAGRHIPFPLDEVYLDFAIVGSAADTAEIKLIAARKEQLDIRMAATKAAGLNPVVMDVESHAACAAISHATHEKYRGKTIGLLRVTDDVLHVSVLRDGSIIYEREQRYRQELVLRNAPGDDAFQHVENRASDSSGINDAVPAICMLLEHCAAALSPARIELVLLAGNGEHLSGLSESIGKHVRFPLAVAHPFAGMSSGAKVKGMPSLSQAATFLVACGLALHGGNA